jgi:hypothetical protein
MKHILFVGELLQLAPVVSNFSMPAVYQLITHFSYWPSIRRFQLKRPMRAPKPLWADFLFSIAKGQTRNIQDWTELETQFRVTVTQNIETAQSFFSLALEPHDPFPLDRQWICAINKLVNQVNHDFQQWRSQRSQSFGVVSAFIQLIKPLSNCPGLSESQQIDSIKRIDTTDVPPNEMHSLVKDPYILLRNMGTRSGLAESRRCSAVELRNRTAVLQFDYREARTLTRIPIEKSSNGMIILRCKLPLRLVFAGTVHRS